MWWEREKVSLLSLLSMQHISAQLSKEAGWADSRAEKGVTQNLPDSLPDKICPAVCSATWTSLGPLDLGASRAGFPAPSCHGDEET